MVLAGRGLMSPKEAQSVIDGMRQVFDLSAPGRADEFLTLVAVERLIELAIENWQEGS
jgi:hypothetical protein